MRTRYLVAQLQTQLLLLAAAGLKEYEADWLKNTDKVVRDATGRFASKATSVAQQTKEKTESVLNETQAKVTNFKQAAENIAKDPKEAKRRVNSKLLDLTGKGLDKLIEKNPEFADQLTSKMFGVDAQKARDKVSQMYKDINPELAEEIKKDPFQEVVDNAKAGKLRKEDLLAAFEYAGNKYSKTLDDLKHLDGPPTVKALGKVAATAIPVSLFLATTLAPEVAMAGIAGEGLFGMLNSAVVGQLWTFGAESAMDALKVDNPLFRLGVDLTVGLGAGSGMLDARGLYRNGIKKSAKLVENNAKKIVNQIPDELRAGVNGRSTAKAERVTFVASGFMGDDGRSGSKLLAREITSGTTKSIFAKDKVIPVGTEKFATGLAMYQNVFLRGRNPVAVDMASQAYAHYKKYPNKPINLIGYCGGGMITNEASAILKELGVVDMKVANFGSPYWGMIKQKGIDVTNYVSKQDKKLIFPTSTNKVHINSVEDHWSYFKDVKLAEQLSDFLNGASK